MKIASFFFLTFISTLYGNQCFHKNNLEQMQGDGEFRVIRELIRDGDIVFDGGANVGLWSTEVIKIKKDIRLYAFEPAPVTSRSLRKRLAGSGAHIFELALADVNEPKEFFFYPDRSGCHSSLFDWYIRGKGRGKKRVTVSCRKIDSLCAEFKINHIDFLKLDVEGAEFVALMGARKMLSAGKINFVQFEYNDHPMANLRGIFDLLVGFGYRLCKIQADELLPISVWSENLENKKFANYLAAAPCVVF